MAESKHIGSGTIHLLFSEFLLVVTGYIIYIGLSRMISAEEFGIYGVIVTLAMIISMIFNASIVQSVSKFVSENKENAKSVTASIFRRQFVISVIATIIYFLLSPVIAMLFNDPSLTPYIQWSSLLILVNPSMYTLLGYFNGMKEFKVQARIQNTNLIAKTFFVLFFVYLGWSVTGAILGFVAAGAASFIEAFFSSKIGFKMFFQKSSAVNFKKIMHFAIPLIFLSIAINLLRSIDLLFLKALIKPVSLANLLTGYYTAALSISRIPFIVILALSFVLFPLISESTFKKDIKATQKYIKKSMRYSLIITIALCFLLSSTAREILPFLYPEEYAAGSSALLILVIGFGFYALYTMLSTVISASGKPKVPLVMTTIMLFINMAMNYLLIPNYKMEGAAFATTFSMFFGLVIASVYVYRRYRVVMELKNAIRIFVIGIIVYLASLIYPTREWWLLLKYPAFGLFMVALLIISGELTKKDLNFFKSSISSLFSSKKARESPLDEARADFSA